MKTIGSHVVMAEDDLVGAPPAARGENPEGVLLLYRQREINEASLAAFVCALLAALQRDERHIDLIDEALVRSGFASEGQRSAVGHEQHDERVVIFGDVLMERMHDDPILRSALTRIAGEVFARLTAFSWPFPCSSADR